MHIPTPDRDFAELYPAILRERCGYRQPPSELDLPMRILDDAGGRAYKALENWFRKNTGDARDALTCYVAARYGVMLETAAALVEEFEANYDGGYN